MKKNLLLLTPLALLLALLLLAPATQAAPERTSTLSPAAPAAQIGGGQWDVVWRGTGALHAFDCAAPDLCFAVGEAGMILKTTDRGQTWHQDIMDGGRDLHGVSARGNIVIAVGETGAAYYSRNAGLTWTQAQTPTGSALDAVSLSPDGDNAWAVGAGGVILHSADGGQTWSAQTSNTGYPLHAVQFLDANTGYAAGEKRTLLKTTDGGAAWTPVSNTFPGWARINALTFTDADTGWIAGQAGYIRMTTDGGQTWQDVNSNTGLDIFSIHFQNGFGVFGGANGSVATSADGQTWTLRASINQDARDVNGVFASGPESSWAVGALKDGSRRSWFITHSADGEHFQRAAGDYAINTRTSAFNTLHETAVAGKDVAYVVGDDGAIGKTVDGGDTWAWSRLDTGRDGYPIIHAISCPTADDCWVVGWVQGEQGFLFATHDGGQTWQRQTLPGFTRPLYDVAMLDAQNGHVAANPDMFYTTDGGQTWQQSTVVGSTANVEIAMASPYEGWTAQRNLGHRYTTNGGKLWQRYMPYAEQGSIYFFGVETLDVDQDGGLDMGWLVGCQGPLVDEQCPANSGVIFYAVGHQDAGYQQLLPPDTPQLYTITMLDNLHGWVGGADGTLLYTDTGGSNWQRVESHTTSLITEIAFHEDKIGFASTYGGEILRFRGPGRNLNSFTQSTPIVVDGEIYDWHYGGGLYLDADNASTVLGDEPYPAPEQLSGEFYSRWTDDALYLMAQIRDDVVGPGDAVRIAIDGLNDDVFDGDDDLLIFVAANGDFGAGSPEADAVIAHAVSPTATGWRLELSIPASLLGRSGLAQNDALGVNLALDDDDGPGASHSLLLEGRGLTAAPATWGDIRLLGDTLTLQEGLNEYEGTSDSFISIWGEDGNVNHGSDDTLYTIYTAGRSYSNTLIRFDLSTLPERAKTGGASLMMYAPFTYARDGFKIGAYRLLRPWDEGTVTWKMADASTHWGTGGALKPGEDYDPAPLDVVPIPVGFRDDWLSWDVSDAVTYWNEHPEQNYGVLLTGVDASQKLYVWSSEYNARPEQRPKLQVDFSLEPRPTPSPTPTPTPASLFLPMIQR